RFSRDIEGFVVTVVRDQLRVTAHQSQRQQMRFYTPYIVGLEGEDGTYLEATIRRIAQEFERSRDRRNDLLESYLTSAILLVSRMVAPPIDEGSADPKLARVEALERLVAAHFREHLPAEAYASRLGLSPTHLNRLVKEVTGQTLHNLTMGRVLDEARRALVFTPATIREVADSLGFADAGYFSRCFRKRTGWTPGDFR